MHSDVEVLLIRYQQGYIIIPSIIICFFPLLLIVDEVIKADGTKKALPGTGHCGD